MEREPDTTAAAAFAPCSDCHWTERTGIDYMGYRMRTANWSITQWVEWDGAKLYPKWDAPVGVELYDHSTDDGSF